MSYTWIDRIMAPLVYIWDKWHDFPRKWDNNYWTFSNRVRWFFHK
jgi:hypothetical protein